MAILLALFKEVRPRQWVKNLSLFAALIFAGLLFQEGAFWKVFQAFIIFTIFSSITYIFNDLVDVEADRKHPYKKSRPIASGELPIPMAIFSLVVGVVVSLSWAMQ